MGSAGIQGPLWGACAQDYAAYLEQVGLPLFSAALDAARVTDGTRFLDAGCGAGLLALLAHLRGAEVSALDASPALLEIARERIPAADMREGDLEALPFEDGSFDGVAVVNSLFYARDMQGAVRELRRVSRPGGRVVLTTWGPPSQCEFLRSVVPALAPLMPSPPPGSPSVHPVLALSEPGALAELLNGAGLKVVEEGQVSCPFVFPNADASWRANASAGPNRLAIAQSGEAAVRSAFAEVDALHTRSDGSIRYENVFLWAMAERG